MQVPTQHSWSWDFWSCSPFHSSFTLPRQRVFWGVDSRIHHFTWWKKKSKEVEGPSTRDKCVDLHWAPMFGDPAMYPRPACLPFQLTSFLRPPCAEKTRVGSTIGQLRPMQRFSKYDMLPQNRQTHVDWITLYPVVPIGCRERRRKHATFICKRTCQGAKTRQDPTVGNHTFWDIQCSSKG